MKKILILEDNPVTSLMLQTLLEHRGYAVDVSDCLVDCFNRLANNIHYDLAIIDYWLGKYGTGKEAEKVMRELRIKAVYYTGDENVQSKEIPVILKGRGADNLLEAIDSILGK